MYIGHIHVELNYNHGFFTSFWSSPVSASSTDDLGEEICVWLQATVDDHQSDTAASGPAKLSVLFKGFFWCGVHQKCNFHDFRICVGFL